MRVIKIFIFIVISICLAPMSALRAKNNEKNDAPRIVNIVNFVRAIEPRSAEITEEVLFNTTKQQANQLKQHRLKGTFLLQYDALIMPCYQELMKNGLYEGSEVGAWWEITQPHVEAAGLKWRGRYPWDWHADVGFATGYTPQEREKLVDVYMEKFKSVFGKYPASVGSWFIDAHTLNYMYEKYHITASCNCKDQIGTDGYTLWGGYWNQAYYPSKQNAYMPAQTEEGQINVPIFRMLGSDPIYQYEAGIGGTTQSVISLEPVYGDAGGNKKWIDYFFKSMFNEPCLSFAYVQAGQENSFTWEAMKKGLEIQIPILQELSQSGKIRVETLGESGAWFKKNFTVTPPTAVVTMDDVRQSEKRTVWYNSRHYRANLLWEGSAFRIRDIHKFDEKMQSEYLTKAGRSNQCIYTTLPLVDGCMWSTQNYTAGLRLFYIDWKGQRHEAKGGIPEISEKGTEELTVKWSFADKSAKLEITFTENKMEVKCKPGRHIYTWELCLMTAPEAELPFKYLAGKSIVSSYRGFNYSIKVEEGAIVDNRQAGRSLIFTLRPERNKITLSF